jgi:hypothetical protein
MAQHILSPLSSLIPKEHEWKMHVFQAWPQILGPLSKRVTLQKIANDSITLSVNHPGLAQELLMMSDLICSKVNEIIGKPVITTIHFRSTTHKKPIGPQAPQKQIITYSSSEPISTDEHKDLLTIEDKELRNALAAFYGACKKRTQ